MKNIYISYVLSFLWSSWFWLGIWVLYYLRFTNYAGIGLVEAIMITTSVLTEIPTGAIADLMGKKKTLFAAFFLGAVGNFIMGVTPNLTILTISVILMTIGGSLHSGSKEALIYDSLKDISKQNLFDKVIANSNTIKNLAFGLTSIVGGIIYAVKPSHPFIAVGLAYSLGAILTLFLSEPQSDSDKFSWSNFRNQTTQGFKQLTKSPQLRKSTVILITLGFFVVIGFEVLNDVLAVEYGFTPLQLGFLAAIIYFTTAAASQLSPAINKLFPGLKSVFFLSLLIALSFFVSPLLGMLTGGLTLIARNSLQGIFENITSVIINKNTESKYRATTLSTFTLIRNIPYVFLAYFIGSLMDSWTAKVFAAVLGSIMLVTIAAEVLAFQQKKR